MNWDQVAGNWKQMKGAAKQRWAKLTDDDMTALSGKRDELVGKIQERYGYTREQAQKEADAWADEVKAESYSTAAAAKKL